MKRVRATAEEDYVDTEVGNVFGLHVTCGRCGYVVEVGGTEEGSMKRAAAMLREGCPDDEDNFYLVG